MTQRTSPLDLTIMIEQFQEKQKKKLLQKCFFKLQDHVWSKYDTKGSDGYGADDNSSDDDADNFDRLMRKRRRIESHAHQDKIIALYKSMGRGSSLL